MIFWRKKKEEPEPQPISPETGAPPELAIPSAPPESTEPAPQRKGLFAKLKDRLIKTHRSIADRARSLFLGGARLDEATLEQLEEILVTADVDVQTTAELVDGLRAAVRRERRENTEDYEWVKDTLKRLIVEQLGGADRSLLMPDAGLGVILIVGVNGSGKTTAIGKLAHRFRQQGKRVVLAAADTFRAAAIDQLQVWGRRAGVEVVAGKEGSDPASVVFDALRRSREQSADVLIVDTAGRLHTKSNLMAELAKIRRVIQRELPTAPHETLLVLDATTGQNGVAQARQFRESTQVTGIVLTKLDGTAKGGVTIAVQRQLGLPVKYIGVGEDLEDLEPFDPMAFATAILD